MLFRSAMTFAPIAAIVPHVKSSRLRALGVTAGVRSSLFPALPTIAESGVPGYSAAGWNALFAPRATPRALILRVHTAMTESLAAARVREALANSGADAAGSTPDEFAAFFTSEIAKWGSVVQAAGIAAE